MNGKGIQILIEAVLVLIAEVMSWSSAKSTKRGKKPGTKDDGDYVSES